MTVTPEIGACTRQVTDELRELFGPYLGTYHRADCSTTPAFWVVNPSQVRPEWTVDGIEVVLDKLPEREPLGGWMTMRRWTVRITNFDPTTDLGDLRLLVYRRWRSAPQRYQPATDDTYERLILELPDPVITQPI